MFKFCFYLKRKSETLAGRPQLGQAGPQAGWVPEGTGLWPAQAGVQAGQAPEAAGLVPAQTEWPGRALARDVRPSAGPAGA